MRKHLGYTTTGCWANWFLHSLPSSKSKKTESFFISIWKSIASPNLSKETINQSSAKMVKSTLIHGRSWYRILQLCWKSDQIFKNTKL
jgi:hypothetical protein